MQLLSEAFLILMDNTKPINYPSDIILFVWSSFLSGLVNLTVR